MTLKYFNAKTRSFYKTIKNIYHDTWGRFMLLGKSHFFQYKYNEHKSSDIDPHYLDIKIQPKIYDTVNLYFHDI